MAYQSLYRKWRPQTFSDIAGQEHVTKTLESEIVSGHISQAYLFCGSRGTGKTTAARVFAKAVNCENPVGGNPCNKCRCCTGITNGSITDVFEIDAASNNGVDDIRAINTESSYLPSGVKYKIYIIDEVHMLSTSAFNALLKTLEEPPEHVIFILATTESHKIPATILSRCQRFDFRYISDSAMYDRLKLISDAEGFEIDDVSLNLIINAAKGGLRDAVSMLDQCSAYNGGKIDDKIVRMVTGVLGTALLVNIGNAILRHDVEKLIGYVKAALSGGYDVARLAECIISHFRNLIVAGSVSDPSSVIEATESDIELIVKQSQVFGTAKALAALEIVMNSYETIKWSQNPRLILETALIRLAHPKADVSYDALLERIEALEARPAVQYVKAVPEAPLEEYAAQIPDEADMTDAEADLPPLDIPSDEEEEEEYVADIPEVSEFDDFEPAVDFAPEESEKPAEAPKFGNDVIFDRWDEVVAHIEEQKGALAAMAVRTGNFRVENNRLTLLGIVEYLKNEDTKQAVSEAVAKVCGVNVEVVFEKGTTMNAEISEKKIEEDPLAALANKMAGKINIIN